jgi:hypothetical protein
LRFGAADFDQILLVLADDTLEEGRVMRALFAFFFRVAPAAAHDDNLRANEFADGARMSPWLMMLPRL